MKMTRQTLVQCRDDHVGSVRSLISAGVTLWAASLLPCGLARGQEPPYRLDQLQQQIVAQEQRILQLEAQVDEQRRVTRRLPDGQEEQGAVARNAGCPPSAHMR